MIMPRLLFLDFGQNSCAALRMYSMSTCLCFCMNSTSSKDTVPGKCNMLQHPTDADFPTVGFNKGLLLYSKIQQDLFFFFHFQL